MKIKFIDDLTFDIYLSKQNISSINVINNKEEVEKLLKEILIKIKNRYNINMEGFYTVNAYFNKYYGIIFNIKKEKLNYYEYFTDQVDINMKIKEANFLYKLDDISSSLLTKTDKINIDNDVVFKIKEELNIKEEMYLIEHTEKILKV